ncbi:MAG: Methyltransferase type 11 [candidate division WWE3 bacterium GW2011_GWF2_41_45]|uniref:Methyltransferase type 11 n=1 Tax=candidate division WWE3 bacterium GW2011_GWC2_41_23 TaxID=1619123 RepID=A0A0G0VRN3_UNCKA|nr:MAG: Methyltransferase type 11 [candidate division WWE3 bacterium GW2011_GWC2_41_23]KKS10711.1 MAG: Methyltransferase type 11 [candidate division WWE3 bacterium GW2011_GWF2_41_45]KKS12278.1 MAG: Methyltransferase type 11 [candidate division WWE3 bacterium GW2011_GWF1_41_53]KKS20351.1 MAG: Methyltransferase type 11 [candidate division WWE3 bacterium GW2011_GWE1_41_72]OGC71950.1 MAG: hypothetical protein A2578_02495 [candidate division WWE3 bacterium RIFOXYD1_FULL_42_24]OGC74651.1 MAG: hypoth
MTSNEYEKQKKLLIETFNKLSSSYKNLFTSDSTQRAKVQSLVNSWNIQRGSKVLEIGGGIGDLSPYLLRKIGTEGELFFLDISPKMVVKARERLYGYNNIRFFCGDITSATFSDSFDSIVVFNTFPHFLNKQKAFSNMYKLLRKGGNLVISHNNSRWGIVGHHKRKEFSSLVSDFPEDSVVFELLTKVGFDIEVFENNEGYDYYLVTAKKNT